MSPNGLFFYWRDLDVPFSVDPRSLYLTTLKDPEYQRAPYIDIRKQGEQILRNTLPVTSQHAKSRFEKGLTILKQGIIIERENEEKYVNDLIKHMKDKKLPDSFIQQFQNLFQSSDSFSYTEFIKLLNILLLGEKNYKQILELESKRGRQLNKAMTRLLTQEQKDEEEKLKAREEKTGIAGYTLKQDLRDTYLDRHSFDNSIYDSYFNQVTGTIDYLLADCANKTIYEALKSDVIKNKILQLIQGNGSNDDLIDTLIQQALAQVMNQIPNIVNQALKANKKGTDTIVNKILNTLTSDETILSKINIEGAKDFGRKNKAARNILIEVDKDTGERKVKETKGTKLADILLVLYKEVDSKDKNDIVNQILDEKVTTSHGISNPEAPQGPKSYVIKELLGQIETLTNDLYNLKHKKGRLKTTEAEYKKSLPGRIAEIKRQISRKAREVIDEKLAMEIEREAKVAAAQKITASLRREVINITGPEFSEIIDTILQQEFSGAKSIFTGPRNAKADTVTIRAAYEPDPLKFPNKEIADAVTKAVNDSTSDFYRIFESELPKTGKATDLKKGRTAWIDAVRSIYNKLIPSLNNHINDGEQQITAMEEIRQMVHDTVIVTTTMKTFTQYQNDIGFLSGSLGPTIQQQLANFAEMFEKAGVPLSTAELTWLEIAIVNCSPGALGSDNLTMIEKYLSVLAGFAVFDEASAEIEILNSSLIDRNGLLQSNPRLMHLYKLNGLYFPGSYILSRMYENLEKADAVLDEKQQEINNDGVKIYATGSLYTIRGKKTDSIEERFRLTYEAASKKDTTFITVAFLSGLINLVNQLKADITDIQ